MRGAGAGVSDMIYLSGEVGLGGGIVLGGRPLTGAGGYAGELGHMLVNPRGRACRCGRSGCWETEIGEDAVLRATRAAPGATLPTSSPRRGRRPPAPARGWSGSGAGSASASPTSSTCSTPSSSCSAG